MAQEQKDYIVSKAKEEWNKLTSEQKKKACADLKKQFPADKTVQSIPCDKADFKTLYTAASAAAGTALCGPLCGAAGAWLASWAGPKVEAWAKDAWEGAKAWAADQVDPIDQPHEYKMLYGSVCGYNPGQQHPATAYCKDLKAKAGK